MRKVSFITLGCKVNQYDTQAMEMAFRERGYEIVPPGERADAVIVNTCTVTAEADRKSRQMVRRAARCNPSAVIVAAGCFPQGNPEAAAAIEGVDIVAGSSGRYGLVEAVDRALSPDRQAGEEGVLIDDISEFGGYEDIRAEGSDGMSRAYLKIEDGCDAYCSYCYVPYVRGHVRSRAITSIEEEAERLASAGYREVVLTGIHLGSYGRDLGGKPRLADAVRAAAKPDGIKRVRLSSLEPTELDDGMMDLFAEMPKLARHLHLPLQSGDDTVLKAMNRHYTGKQFLEKVDEARSRIGEFGLTTDVIAGFPGETEEMFENTVAVVKRAGVMRAHVFPYSRRKGTPADLMQGQIPPSVKQARCKRLIAEAGRLAEEYHRRMVGKDYEVILEKESIIDGGFRYEGYTSDYVKVGFDSPSRLACCAIVSIVSCDAEGAAGKLVR
ncbi:MAG TPA: tRNA (N(6)-L-threonylcarbamoyladenosine(37)-C(2))-methylthiotransferase MtaB [Bacillota bacterium]|nr:tRNA (N(6)-L-threonylcarbamoyladenosine(37)-C(2))-methylthiotransferase MtaB [Bacillota bacterium]HOA15817.1 tRNA (N(6)-L-threonylcarbamoyladenosine(37)-C(2))-methylthiotransferase MtaB [Bacillota bacterium]